MANSLTPKTVALPVNGEKAAAQMPAQTLVVGEIPGDSIFLPVTIRGEMSGRTNEGQRQLPPREKYLFHVKRRGGHVSRESHSAPRCFA